MEASAGELIAYPDNNRTAREPDPDCGMGGLSTHANGGKSPRLHLVITTGPQGGGLGLDDEAAGGPRSREMSHARVSGMT